MRRPGLMGPMGLHVPPWVPIGVPLGGSPWDSASWSEQLSGPGPPSQPTGHMDPKLDLELDISSWDWTRYPVISMDMDGHLDHKPSQIAKHDSQKTFERGDLYLL